MTLIMGIPVFLDDAIVLAADSRLSTAYRKHDGTQKGYVTIWGGALWAGEPSIARRLLRWLIREYDEAWESLDTGIEAVADRFQKHCYEAFAGTYGGDISGWPSNAACAFILAGFEGGLNESGDGYEGMPLAVSLSSSNGFMWGCSDGAEVIGSGEDVARAVLEEAGEPSHVAGAAALATYALLAAEVDKDVGGNPTVFVVGKGQERWSRATEDVHDVAESVRARRRAVLREVCRRSNPSSVYESRRSDS